MFTTSLRYPEQEPVLSGLMSTARDQSFVILIGAKGLQSALTLPSFAVLGTDGLVELSVDGAVVTLGPHTYLITNPHQTVRMVSKPSSDIRLTTASLTSALLTACYQELRIASRRLFRSGRCIQGRSIVFHNDPRPHDPCVSPVLRRIESACRLGVRDRQWLEGQLRLLAERMLFVEHRRVRPGTNSRVRRGPLASRLIRVRDYIDSSYDRPLKLEQMAQLVYASPYHFLRMFKNTYGQTPHQYLISRRLEASRNLLETTDLPIKEISERVGFQNANGFYKAFKRSFDCSPADFRQRNAHTLRDSKTIHRTTPHGAAVLSSA